MVEDTCMSSLHHEINQALLIFLTCWKHGKTNVQGYWSVSSVHSQTTSVSVSFTHGYAVCTSKFPNVSSIVWCRPWPCMLAPVHCIVSILTQDIPKKRAVVGKRPSTVLIRACRCMLHMYVCVWMCVLYVQEGIWSMCVSFTVEWVWRMCVVVLFQWTCNFPMITHVCPFFSVACLPCSHQSGCLMFYRFAPSKLTQFTHLTSSKEIDGWKKSLK